MNCYDDFYSNSNQNTMMGGFTPMQKMNQMSPLEQMDQTPMPSLPTGIPGGGLVGNVPMPMGGANNIDIGTQHSSSDNIQFVAGYLRTQIGKNVRVEFLVGTNGPLIDRIGTLLGVGTSYILIRPLSSRETVMCDLYSIRFVTVYPDFSVNPMPPASPMPY